MVRSVAYTRKSVDSGKYNTIERDLERFKLLGFADEDIYFDILSGDDDKRINFNLIWKEIKSGDITSLTITRDDRLGRKASTLLQIYKDIEVSKCKLIILDDYGDTDFANPYEWERRAVSVIRSESERRMLIMRIRKGQDFVLMQGKSLGGRCPYGYYRDKNKIILIKEEMREQLEDIASITVSTSTLSESCKKINNKYNLQWREPQLRHWIHCASLRGHVGWKNITNNLHQKSDSPIYERMLFEVTPSNRIMSEKMYQKFKEKSEMNKQLWGQSQRANFYPLRGMCECAFCGATLSHNNNGKVQLRHPYNVKSEKKEECKYVLRADYVEKIVIDFLINYSSVIAEKLSLEKLEEVPPDLIKIEADINTLKLMDNPLLQDSIENLEMQRKSIIAQNTNTTNFELKRNLELVNNQLFWDCLSDLERHNWYKYFIEKIIVCKKDKETFVDIVPTYK